MGTDIGTAAQMFTNMAANGTVMARSLGSIGLNMQGLADAVNSVDPSLNATATNLTTVFKSMDPDQRTQALTQAFSNLDGVAQKVAQDTFSGQWTVLANQWDSVMVSVGKDIMPVVTGLMGLVTSNVLPFIKELADDFGALPGPVKDVAVGLGLWWPPVRHWRQRHWGSASSSVDRVRLGHYSPGSSRRLA